MKFLTIFLLLLSFMTSVAQNTWAGTDLMYCREAHLDMLPKYSFMDAPFYDEHLYSVLNKDVHVQYFYSYDTLTEVSEIYSHYSLTYMTVIDDHYVNMLRQINNDDPNLRYVRTVDSVAYKHNALLTTDRVLWSDLFYTIDEKAQKTMTLFKCQHGYLLIQREALNAVLR